ncbi:alpha/beta hydrolase [Kineothrix sp. MSJ-39]|uniref:alpha/beta hydrolase n=1 Tax=Kineothrix sp. MSJ-39 TaxID=2841533 RepID=UPI001C10969E|nr:alpha/beta hydrolase [Kineothrix sp. MSJ-39]MBU5429757.1 alpha/beta hydrolase [Kineothrix sp. MSJ-39]
MSVKYTIIKTMFHIIPMQKMMAKPYDELMKMFHTAEAKPSIPKLKDPEFIFRTHKIEAFPVLEISHKKRSDHVCIYVAGGGMLKYPKPAQAKELIPLAKETGRNMLLPYFPLAREHDLIDALNMLYATYKMALKHYPAENIAFLGGSSGAAMVLWLMSYINQQGEGIPMPGKIALSSPGSALTAEERKRAEELNKTDLIMSTTALDNIFKGMVGGKELPEELLYTSKGIYDGIKDVYLSYGGDEVFSAAAQSTAQRLRSYGAKVTLEIAQGMYHTYAVMPLVKEAKPGHQRLVAYLRK